MTKRNKIRSSGCDYELGDIGGHKKNQATSVSSGPSPRGVIICEDFAMLDAGRQREEKKNEKTQLIVFCQPHKTPSGSKKKKEIKRAGSNSIALLEPFAGQFIGAGESDVRPRHFQTRRIGGPGRG